MKSTIVLLALAVVAAGCRWERDAEARLVNAAASDSVGGWRNPAEQSPLPGGMSSPDSAEEDSESLVVSGRVAETMNAAGYTYLRIATTHGNVWAAVPEVEINVGDPVTVNGQLTMENFESKTLRRTFDRIIFGTIAGTSPASPDRAVEI